MKHFPGSITSCTSPNIATYKAIAPPKIQFPNAPLMKPISLPSSSITPPSSVSPGTDDLYPLTLQLAHIPPTHQSKLETIVLTTPIHLRTPSAHIGTIYSDTPKRTINALDALIILRTLASSHSTPSRLPCTLPTTLDISQARRCRESSVDDV